MKYWLSLLMIPETDQLVEIARIAEEVGFHGVTMADHLVMPATFETPYPYTPNGEVFWPAETAWPRCGGQTPLGSCLTERLLIGPAGNAAYSSYARRSSTH